MAKLTMDDYAASLWNKKTEAHDKQWLYIEINRELRTSTLVVKRCWMRC